MNILLAITGSISAYKTYDICKQLINRKHNVKVVLSKGALEFIKPEVFKYLGVEEVYYPNDDFKNKGVLHIELSKWLDSFVLCPATANTMAKLAHGISNDLLTSTFLSLSDDKVKLIFPAMNTFMFNNYMTQNNIHILKFLKQVYIIKPDSGILACGDIGEGKLPSVETISEIIPLFSNKEVEKNVLITAGATISSIDDVRYVTNPAKGATAYLLAKKYLSEGFNVHVIKGKYSMKEFDYLEKHSKYTSDTVITTQDLLECVRKNLKHPDNDIYISPMAVSDIEFDYKEGKIKKSDMEGKFLFKQAFDVLHYVLYNRSQNPRYAKQIIVGFAAETDLSEEVIKEKLKRKPVDLLVANKVNSGLTGQNKQGFGTREGKYVLAYIPSICKEYYLEDKECSKEELVNFIYDATIHLLERKNNES